MDDRGFQRCREAHGLALLRKDRGDAANGWEKAHVEHPIGFVENQDAEIFEVEEAASEEVLEAAGSGYDQARAFTDGAELGAFGKATYDAGCGLKLSAAEQVVNFDDLHG